MGRSKRTVDEGSAGVERLGESRRNGVSVVGLIVEELLVWNCWSSYNCVITSN